MKEDILARVILLCYSSGIFFGQLSYFITFISSLY